MFLMAAPFLQIISSKTQIYFKIFLSSCALILTHFPKIKLDIFGVLGNFRIPTATLNTVLLV